MSETPNNYEVYTDGGARGNPGPAAYGFVIVGPNGQTLKEVHHYIGETTNNQAEYQGLVAALTTLQLMDLPAGSNVVCNLDSQLVVRQVNGQYKMKSPDLMPWLAKIQALRDSLVLDLTFIDIPRAKNKRADALVNQALDEVTHV